MEKYNLEILNREWESLVRSNSYDVAPFYMAIDISNICADIAGNTQDSLSHDELLASVAVNIMQMLHSRIKEKNIYDYVLGADK